jgi:hypothetical protein
MGDTPETTNAGATPTTNTSQPHLATNERVVGWVILREGSAPAFSSARVEPIEGLSDLEYTGIWYHCRRIFGGHTVSSL